MFGDSNGQIKLRIKQKIKFLSATTFSFDHLKFRLLLTFEIDFSIFFKDYKLFYVDIKGKLYFPK